MERLQQMMSGQQESQMNDVQMAAMLQKMMQGEQMMPLDMERSRAEVQGLNARTKGQEMDNANYDRFSQAKMDDAKGQNMAHVLSTLLGTGAPNNKDMPQLNQAFMQLLQQLVPGFNGQAMPQQQKGNPKLKQWAEANVKPKQ